MEAVRTFNNELSSLYESRPPISRAKMTHVTKCAIKAIKFYKHVVQSVEKFILKCKPEYKVPGLYVIDSIVRQSRHQFGQEKDVYAPRFTKNIVTTFQNLLKCPTDEKSKIVRVLNLWQKNAVFPMDVIQPLMDLAGDPANMDIVAAAQKAVDRIMPTKTGQQKSNTPAKAPVGHKIKAAEPALNSQASADSILTTQTDMLNTVNQLLQQSQQPQSLDEQEQQLQQLQVLQQQLLEQTQMMQQPENQGPVIDNTLLAQIQTLTNQLLNRTGEVKPPEPGFNKTLLDFDYGESDEDDDRKERGPNNNNAAGQVQHLLTDPSLMEHIQQMSQSIQKSEQGKNDLNLQEQIRQQMLQQQQDEFDQQINQQAHGMHRGQMHIPPPGHPMMPPQFAPNMEPPRDQSQDMDTDEVVIVQENEYGRDRAQRGRDRSRSPKRRRRSRSRSRDRRKRSRSRERHRRSRSGDREKLREKERERWKKRLPPIKDKHVSVCSTTLFIGHLAKFTSEEEVVRELENFGAVDSINMIPPRGCAFVCLNRRKDAAKAVEKLKGAKINGSTIKIAWAPGKGLKDLDFKNQWYVDLGVTYIPWDKLPSDLSLLVDGGMIDEDTIPDHLKEMAAAVHKTETVVEEKKPVPQQTETPPAQFTLPPGGPPSGPPVIPPGQPPFPPPMPGMPGNSIQVLQAGPPVGMLNPMLIPMPGQPMPTQVGMHPIISLPQPRIPQVNTSVPISLMSIPNQPSTTSAGSQLNAAIQNIMSSSAGQTPVKQTIPQLVRPGFNSPRPGVFPGGFNPHGFNPNVPPPRGPPPNFRMPPPSFQQGGGQLGDGDSTPEQDEGQATVTKVISNDWPNKFPNREGGDDRERFPNSHPFGQPPSDNRMPDQNMLQTPPIGSRMAHPRGPNPSVFSQHDSPMNPNSPRPLLGQRMLQPDRPDLNGPPNRQFMGGHPGLNRPFGLGNQMMGDMGGPQPLMSARFASPRGQPPPLLGLRPGFPGNHMFGPPPRFQGGQRQPGFGHPRDERMRPPFDSPNRPFERPEFNRFGDRMRFPPPQGPGPDDRGPMSDRWGPIDGPPGMEREHGEHGAGRFERIDFRREKEGTPDWRENRRDNRNPRGGDFGEIGPPENFHSQGPPRDHQEKSTEKVKDKERFKDKDRSRRSRWSNLDPSQSENAADESKSSEPNLDSKMDSSIDMDNSVDMDTSVDMECASDLPAEGSVDKNISEDNKVISSSEKNVQEPVKESTKTDLNVQSEMLEAENPITNSLEKSGHTELPLECAPLSNIESSPSIAQSVPPLTEPVLPVCQQAPPVEDSMVSADEQQRPSNTSEKLQEQGEVSAHDASEVTKASKDINEVTPLPESTVLLAQEPLAGKPSQEPMAGNTPQEPVVEKMTQEPVAGNVPQEPVIENLAQEPVSGNVPQEPVIENLAREPVSGNVPQEHVENTTQRPNVIEGPAENGSVVHGPDGGQGTSIEISSNTNLESDKCSSKDKSPMEEGELEPGEVSS